MGAAALLAAVYFVAGKLGLLLAVVHPSASPVWPPAGIALAALLAFGRRLWPGVLVGAFLVNVTTEGSVLTSLGIAVGNTLEALLGAVLVDRFAGGRRAFDAAQNVFRFAFLAGMVSTTVAATFGVTSLCLGGFADWARYDAIWLTWWLGDLGGDLVVAPLLVVWAVGPTPRWTRGQGLEASLVFLALAAVGLTVFGGLVSPLRNRPLEFLYVPPLLWAAFRLGPQGGATASFLLSTLAVGGTLRGLGPFAMEPRNESLLLLQLFLAVITVTSLAVAALVSERRRVEDALRRVAAIVESSDDAIIGKALDGTITSWNRGAEAVFGHAEAEALGRPVTILVPPERAPAALELIERLRRGERIEHFETEAVRKGGGLIDVSLTLSPIRDAEGRVVGASTIGRDISERRRLEEIRRRGEELAEETRHVHETTRLKAEFISNVSHELRTPLQAILGFAELMHEERAGEVSPEQKEFLGDILANARHLLRLIDDVLELGRLEAGRLVLRPEPVHVGRLTGEVAEALGPMAETKGIAFATRVEEGLDRVVLDPVRLKQVLYNYLSNALKFTPEGGRVTVRFSPEGRDALRLEVEDTGIGIGAQDLGRLFVAFQQLDSSLGKRYSGTGLGLALTRRIVEAQGGAVGVRSAPGQGSTFFAVLPRAPAPHDEG